MTARKSLLQKELDSSSSDDDDDYFILSTARIVQPFANEKGRWGGSIHGHQVLYRDREDGHIRMFQDYLADDPTYPPHLFRRRFVHIHLCLVENI